MTGEPEARSEANLQSELSHLKGIMSQLLDTRSSANAQHWKGEFESATSELLKVQQQLEEVSKRCSINSAGTQSMANGIQDLEKQVAVLPAESEHKLRLMSAQMQAAETRHQVEKGNLEHRLATVSQKGADSTLS